MAPVNIAACLADAWDQITTLSGYGTAMLTVGWWRGDAYVRVWNFRTGESEWRRFETTRPARKNPWIDPFASAWLYKALR